MTEMIEYSMDDMKRIQQVEYMLPLSVVAIIQKLEKLIVIPIIDQPKRTSNTSIITRPNSNHKRHPPNKFVPKHASETLNEWSPVRSFKPTKLIVSDAGGVQKDINDIRSALNKISNKNYDTQKTLIMTHIESAHDSFEDNEKIANFIFDIATSNKFYSDLYAALYEELIEKFPPMFRDILMKYIETYKQTITSIKYRDANTDYDGYCAYVKETDHRKAMATFIVNLSSRNVLCIETFIGVIQHMQSQFMSLKDEADKSQECEDLAELIYIVVSLGNTLLVNNDLELWGQVYSTIIFISKQSSKDKTYPSLSSRAIFKHLDLVDFLKKHK